MNRHRLRYVVQDGDRLSDIAETLGVWPEQLIALNPSKPTMLLPSGVEVFATLAAGEELLLPDSIRVENVGLGNPVAVGIGVSVGAAAILEATKTLYRSAAGDSTVCEEVYGGSWSYSKDKCIGPEGQTLDSTMPGLCHNLGGLYDASANACYCSATRGCTQMAPFILERFPELAEENRKLPPFREIGQEDDGKRDDGDDTAHIEPQPVAPPAPPTTTTNIWPIALATGAVVVVGLGAAAVSVKLIVDAIERSRGKTQGKARSSNPAPRIMNLEQYAKMTKGKTSADVQAHIHAGLRSMPTSKTYKRFFDRKLAELQDAADRTRADYYAAIERGEIAPPPQRSLEETADRDDAAGEAARRVLKRRAARVLASGK